MIPSDVSKIVDALDRWCSAAGDLKELGVVRSQKVLSDLSEWFVAEIYGGKRVESKTHPGYDVVVAGAERIQVKHAAKAKDNPARWHPIKSLKQLKQFDSLELVIFSDSYKVR